MTTGESKFDCGANARNDRKIIAIVLVHDELKIWHDVQPRVDLDVGVDLDTPGVAKDVYFDRRRALLARNILTTHGESKRGAPKCTSPIPASGRIKANY